MATVNLGHVSDTVVVVAAFIASVIFIITLAAKDDYMIMLKAD